MKPGDLVELTEDVLRICPAAHRDAIIGMIVGFDGISSKYPIQILIDGKILNFNKRELRPLVNPDAGGYDNTKEST